MTESLDTVVHEHYDRVYRVALSIVGNRDDAEDVAQDVFVAVMRGLSSFRGDSALGTWIYRIAIRTAMRWQSRRRPTEALPESQRADDASLPLDLINALAALPTDARMVVLLVSIEGLTQAEAADVLGIPEGTVGSRLHYARRRLAEALGD